MAKEFRLPDIGEGLTEAEIVRWLIPEGGAVKADQPVVEVETDKAVVEIPSPYGGVVLHHGGAEGQTLAVGRHPGGRARASRARSGPRRPSRHPTRRPRSGRPGATIKNGRQRRGHARARASPEPVRHPTRRRPTALSRSNRSSAASTRMRSNLPRAGIGWPRPCHRLRRCLWCESWPKTSASILTTSPGPGRKVGSCERTCWPRARRRPPAGVPFEEPPPLTLPPMPVAGKANGIQCRSCGGRSPRTCRSPGARYPTSLRSTRSMPQGCWRPAGHWRLDTDQGPVGSPADKGGVAGIGCLSRSSTRDWMATTW